MEKRCCTSVAGCVVALGVAAGARGQWTVTVLTPPGVSAASANSVGGGIIAGDVSLSGLVHAAVWRGTAASFIDMNPAGANVSGVRVARDGTLVGWARFNGMDHAGMWTGWPPVWVDLSPPGARNSQVADSSGGVRGGMVMPLTTEHAALWMGPPESWVDLNPTGVFSSFLDAVRDGIQVGQVDINGDGGEYASIWTGTAASWVNLNPAGSTYSQAFGVTDDHRILGTAFGHAGYWRGTAASWVDMNPLGAQWSDGPASFGDVIVGEAGFSGHNRAWMWRGTPPVSEDLSVALRGGWADSFANGVWSDGTTLYVAGWAVTVPVGPDDAVVWSRPLCYANCDASTAVPVLNVNDFVCFMTRFANGDGYANCDGSTVAPVLNVNDFVCFVTSFAQGCS